MKKIIFVCTLFFAALNLSAQKEQLNQLFDRYQDIPGVTSIKIAKPMFSMLNKLNLEDAELDQIKPLLNKINGIKILLMENGEGAKGKPNALSFSNLQSEISASLKKLNYEELITVNSKDNKIKFLSADATGNSLENLLLSIISENNTVLMMLDGKISMDDVNKLIEQTQTPPSPPSPPSAPAVPALPKPDAQGDADYTREVRAVGKFTGISATDGIRVNFTQGKDQSLSVETDPGMQAYVSTEVQNGILMLTLKKDNRKSLRFRRLTVNVQAPQLTDIKIANGATFQSANTLEEKNFTAEISTGAKAELNLKSRETLDLDITSGGMATGTLSAKNLKLRASSGASANLSGSADTAFYKISSAASVQAAEFQAKNVDITASSGSNAKIYAGRTLTATVSGGASVRYAGNPAKVNSDAKSTGGSFSPLN